MRKVQKGNVSIKIWDIGGQPRFRGMWERYCRGVNVIVYMVDAADHDKLEAATNELHQLMDKPQLQVILNIWIFVWSHLEIHFLSINNNSTMIIYSKK